MIVMPTKELSLICLALTRLLSYSELGSELMLIDKPVRSPSSHRRSWRWTAIDNESAVVLYRSRDI